MQVSCQTFHNGLGPTLDEGVVRGGAQHASSNAFAALSHEERLAERLLPDLLRRFPRSVHRTAARLALKFAHLRRNLTVTCAQRLWCLRRMATAEQMLCAVLSSSQLVT